MPSMPPEEIHPTDEDTTTPHTQHADHPAWSRAPRRYHRRSLSLTQSRPQGLSTTPELSVDDYSTDTSDFTDHAVEADDEKGPLLRQLPAPPLRARKGLRGHDSPLDSTPFVSPLQTPVVEKRPSVWAGPQQEVKTIQQEQAKDDEAERYGKYLKRRRAEIVRRTSETILLVLMGAGTFVRGYEADMLQPWKAEQISFFFTVGALYALYPWKICWSRFRQGFGAMSAIRRGFHIPSRFDLGPLSYPVFLPLLTVVALGKIDGAMLLTNLILGLCALPTAVIPLNMKPSLSYVHWLISAIPLFAPECYFRKSEHYVPVGLRMSKDVPTWCEELSLIFPLQQSLLATVEYLTTTSLDPSEAQLLSAGLVNLLLFAKSPQANILKALIWVGGLSLFAFCGKVLSWEVALARIPSWKFARNRPTKTGLMGRVNKLLTVLLPESPSRFATSSSLSDSESEGSHNYKMKNFKNRAESESQPKKRSTSDTQFSTGSVTNGSIHKRTGFSDLSRSATFSTFGQAAAIAVRWRRRVTSYSRFLSLTYAQARACKWLFALYIYLAVAMIVIVPVRYFISVRALSSLEPIGWAVGYFVGDVPQARMLVVNNNLERWIALPTHRSQYVVELDAGWFEIYRQTVTGAANMRLLLAAYCVLVVACGLGLVQQLKSVVEVDTRRKVFHGVMVAMLVPTIPVDPCFFALALAIVLAVFLMLDLFRASQLPPISKPLTNFLAPYVDGRDHRGPVVVSHIFLLIGCAIPLWLALAGAGRSGVMPWNGWDTPVRDLSMVSGVICVGMGDAAASLVGRRYGRTKWYWGGGKSIEGSLAFASAVTVGLVASYLWLHVGGWSGSSLRELPVASLKAAVAGCGASLLESTLTAANDNVVVPVGLWLLVRALKI